MGKLRIVQQGSLSSIISDIYSEAYLEESMALGRIKWIVYKVYLNYFKWHMVFMTIFTCLIFEVLILSSSIWLTLWVDDKTMVVNGMVDKNKRDYYLYGYMAFGGFLGMVFYTRLDSFQYRLFTLTHCLYYLLNFSVTLLSFSLVFVN